MNKSSAAQLKNLLEEFRAHIQQDGNLGVHPQIMAEASINQVLESLNDGIFSDDEQTFNVCREYDILDKFEVTAANFEDAAIEALNVLGWQVTQPVDNSTIFDHGYDAYYNEKSLEDNPHEEGDKYDEWERGFRAADSEDDSDALEAGELV